VAIHLREPQSMRILLYGINFAPELTGAGKYTSEMATALAAAGHEVRVVTAQPYFPDWRIAPGYPKVSYLKERIGDIDVWRAPLYVPSRPTGVRRILHLASFAITSIPLLLRQIAWKPHVVWMAAPTLLCAPGAWFTARAAGALSWLHVQDLEVDAAFELGVLRGGTGRRVAVRFERWLLQRFDRVSSITPKLIGRLRSKGVDPQRLVLFPNWVDTQVVRPLDNPSSYRRELGIADDTVVALYSGSMGAKQGLELMAHAARLLDHDPRLVFVFCGQGPGRPALRWASEGLKNVRFLPLQPADKLNDLLGLADIHLLPQRRGASDLVMPSKLVGMLASGRPIVATAEPRTTLAEIVEPHGLVVPPEDPQAMALAISTLLGAPQDRARLGRAARSFAEQYLAPDRVLGPFERRLRTDARADEPAGGMTLEAEVARNSLSDRKRILTTQSAGPPTGS
jgi:colanic acid biosynthesis glycosyl transferase WcaI